jgi:hypothetical protein
VVPIGEGQPELRIYVTSQTTGELELRYSQITTLDKFHDLAEAQKRAFLARGWEVAR